MSPESPSDVRLYGLWSDNYLHVKSGLRRQVHFRSGRVPTAATETRKRVPEVYAVRCCESYLMQPSPYRLALISRSIRERYLGRSPAHSRRSCRPTPAVPSYRPDSPTPTTPSPEAASRPVLAGDTALRTGIGRAVARHSSGTGAVGATVRGSTPRRSIRIAMNQLHVNKKPPPSTEMDAGTNLTRSLPASRRAARSYRPEIDGQPRQ